MADIVSLDLLEDELNTIMQAGGYRSREDTVVHALEVLRADELPEEIRAGDELIGHLRRAP